MIGLGGLVIVMLFFAATWAITGSFETGVRVGCAVWLVFAFIGLCCIPLSGRDDKKRLFGIWWGVTALPFSILMGVTPAMTGGGAFWLFITLESLLLVSWGLSKITTIAKKKWSTE